MMAAERNSRYPRAEDALEDLRFWQSTRSGTLSRLAHPARCW